MVNRIIKRYVGRGYACYDCCMPSSSDCRITSCACLIHFGTPLFQVMPIMNVAFLIPSSLYTTFAYMLHHVPMLFVTVIPTSFNMISLLLYTQNMG